MNTHRAVIEAGPGAIRRLCCPTSDIGDAELVSGALGAIDDAVALVNQRPVAVDSLWSAALRSVVCEHCDGVVVVYPSWWSGRRMSVVTAAAQTLPGDVVVRPRSWLLGQASPDTAAVVVEIAGQLVLVGGEKAVGIARVGEPRLVAEEVAGAIAGPPRGMVLIDGPGTVAAAPELARLIADAVCQGGRTAVLIDESRLARLAASCTPVAAPPVPRLRPRAVGRFAAVGTGLIVVMLAALRVPALEPHRVTALEATTSLVEGRVALTIPANWPTERVVSGPGSARVQVTSPSDPEVALHVTQSAVAEETLAATAERLKRAIDAEPAGVFVDFNASGISAGRTAVTYREVRTGHDVRWTVLLDGGVRISIGCQSRPTALDAVRDACEQAVRSAHALA
ncbi:type VII secretion-associated protein [Mycobacterium angelicum]|uniref:Type VII secretion-associated protein n=1 Tax=Mycobacterium angelicum TaxID=470074 RepID=A0A1W9ZWP2_MYCAN|nr:type VII secretion-associated protein [Mycobacterium angelicum]MCV7199732.1 type VII secretion-associated protein [Mycobacterium angelicum]ORA22183.1 type VII secretion-associated protein [Mycobacterium angelicum]